MTVIIDGLKVSADINAASAASVERMRNEYGRVPGLAVILVGDDPASQVYVNSKDRKCRELGIHSEKYVLDKNASMAELLRLIDRLNNDPNIHGILVQSPPPPQIDEEKVVAAIVPEKDVDCFHPVNVGKMLLGRRDGFFPCTPYGVMLLLDACNIDPSGKHAVIVGRSNIVGKPLMAMLVQKEKGANATVTCVHSATANLPEITRQADILVAAIGKPRFITADMVKTGVTIIDVGINRIPDATKKSGFRLVGDVDFDAVSPKCAAITPVPGGVGPMTIAVLMQNTVKSAEKAFKR
ncbi:MAG: bifunctional methylenetetrahydrofolate dehydrogenase/methenyltetrahydrofolate cyclohydrolase FolD [Victivallaceae bacterium]|nr:bifunctional methylenetetrahydrofolate dehydrogenase/methenyltetrahydrofolate cyclohydrolase FolD [Victivallaceae bacterium]